EDLVQQLLDSRFIAHLSTPPLPNLAASRSSLSWGSTALPVAHPARQGEPLRSPGGGNRDAEPGVAVASRGLDVEADRRTAVARTSAPRPAAPNAKVSLFGALRIFIICFVVLAISVRAPLPDVAMHVVQAPVVGLERPHR